jgi:hypothetical protein
MFHMPQHTSVVLVREATFVELLCFGELPAPFPGRRREHDAADRKGFRVLYQDFLKSLERNVEKDTPVKIAEQPGMALT